MRTKIYSSTLRPKAPVPELPENWEDMCYECVDDYLDEYIESFNDPRPHVAFYSLGDPIQWRNEYRVTVTCTIEDMPVFHLNSFKVGYETVKLQGECIISYNDVRTIPGGWQVVKNNDIIPYTIYQAETLSKLLNSEFDDYIKDSLETFGNRYDKLQVSNINVETSPGNRNIHIDITADVTFTLDPNLSEHTKSAVTIYTEDIKSITFFEIARSRCVETFSFLLKGKLDQFEKIYEHSAVYEDDLASVIQCQDRLEQMIDNIRSSYQDVSFDIDYQSDTLKYLDRDGGPRTVKSFIESDATWRLYYYKPLTSGSYLPVELVISLGNYENVYKLNLMKLPSEKSFERTIKRKIDELREAVQ